MKKKGKRVYNQTVINIVTLVAVICLLIYVIVQLFGHGASAVSTQRTQAVTDSEYSYATGYIFRYESEINKSGGVVDFLVENGEKVGADQVYGYFYPTPDKSEKEIKELQGELDRLSARISMLRSDGSGALMVSDLASVNKKLSKTYYSYADFISIGDYFSADGQGEQLLEAIVDYRVITGRDGKAEDVISELERQKRELLSGLGVGQALVSDIGCYIYTDADGYEETFSPEQLNGMTASALNGLISAKAADISGVIGKITVDPRWFVAVPITEAESTKFKEGITYSVTFSDSNALTLSMRLERIYVGEDGSYLLFSGVDLSLMPRESRAQNIKIYISSVSGYRIPEEALTRLDGEDGVYILVGNTVEFRRVSVVGKGNKYYIVKTYEEDAEEEMVKDLPYLNVNDLIITSGNDLYHGKRLD